MKRFALLAASICIFGSTPAPAMRGGRACTATLNILVALKVTSVDAVASRVPLEDFLLSWSDMKRTGATKDERDFFAKATIEEGVFKDHFFTGEVLTKDSFYRLGFRLEFVTESGDKVQWILPDEGVYWGELVNGVGKKNYQRNSPSFTVQLSDKTLQMFASRQEALDFFEKKFKEIGVESRKLTGLYDPFLNFSLDVSSFRERPSDGPARDLDIVGRMTDPSRYFSKAAYPTALVRQLLYVIKKIVREVDWAS